MANASRWLPVVAALLGAGLTGLSAPAASAAGPGGFVGTWAASPMLDSTSSLAENGLANRTIRDVVHASVAGTQVRVRLSNVSGYPAMANAVNLALL